MSTRKYNPDEIATWFINTIYKKTGDSITNLKLQKLLYYAQAWHLVFFEMPLFDEDFKAWAYGPVLTSIYAKLKKHGNNEIPIIKHRTSNIGDPNVEQLLEEVLSVYGGKSVYHLIDLTHSEKPWIDARGNIPREAKCNNIIDKLSMKNFYSAKLKEANGKE
ncbi:MAG: DUF4065 domain-containing protein [Candidatus Auribacterota bacterium]|jgi:uncharacterized phage-associated protein|nr:DUF4065 domain-containing protein [Candidatus Auribacterota bacterium]